MEIKEFPKTMDRLLSEQQSAELVNANIVSRENQRQARQDIKDQNKKIEGKSLGMISVGSIAGFIIGLIACTCMCVNEEMGSAIVTLVICTLLGPIVGMVLGSIVSANNSKKVKQYNRSINSEDVSRGQQTDEIRKKYEAMRSNYQRQFMEQAMARKNWFARSETGAEIYQWLFAEICRSIDLADRGVNVGQVDKAFTIGVLSRAVRSDFGMYDFGQHKVAELMPLDQTALAYALCDRFQTELQSKYAMDASGTSAEIKYEVDLTENVANILITYKAVNGNYQK